jgi:hypothetical protein
MVSSFCRYDVPWELRSDQGHNFDSRLIQVLQSVIWNKTPTANLHPQLESVVERYKNFLGALTKILSTSPQELGKIITHLPPRLQGIHSRHHGLDPS